MILDLFQVCVITLLYGSISANNISENFITMNRNNREYQSRQNRLLSFDTGEDGSVEVELAFNVPFLRIPVKKTMDVTKGAIANLNVAAVVLAGMMIFGASIFIPAALHFLTKKAQRAPTEQYGRRSDEDLPEWQKLLATLDKSLLESNVNSTSCMQRVVCWVVKNSSVKVATGTATSRDKIIDGLASNEWVNYLLLRETIFEEAVTNGLNGINCSKLYNSCKFSQRSLNSFVKYFVKTINLTK